MADAMLPLRHRHQQTGLQQLPKEVLVKILRLVDEKEWRKYDQLSPTTGRCRFTPRPVHETARRSCGGSRVQQDGGIGTGTLLPLRGVCRGFRAAVDEAMRRFLFSAPSTLSPAEREQLLLWWGFSLRDVMPRWPHLTAVTLVFDWKASHLMLVLRALQQGCPALEALSVENPLTTSQLSGLARSHGLRIGVLAPLQNLTTLTLRGFAAYHESWLAELGQLSSLRNLTLKCTGAVEALAPPTGLTRLCVDENRQVNYKSVMLTLPPNLVELHLSRAKYSCIRLTNHTSLRKLALHKLGLATFGFSACPLPSLTRVSLEDLPFSKLAWLGSSAQLTAVHLHDLHELDVEALSHLSQLQRLCISGRDEVLNADFRQLSSLHSLTLHGYDVSEWVLVPWLRSFHLSNPPRWGDLPDMLARIAGATSLTRLHLSGISVILALPDLTAMVGLLTLKLDDLGILSLEGSGIPPSVRHLALASMLALSSLGPLNSVRSLQDLEISGCRKLPSVELAGLQCLEFLTIHDCETLVKLKVVGLPKLQRALICKCNKLAPLVALEDIPHLEVLRLRECPTLKSLVLGPGLARLDFLELTECGALEKVLGLAAVKQSGTVVIKGCKDMQMIMSEDGVGSWKEKEDCGYSDSSSGED